MIERAAWAILSIPVLAAFVLGYVIITTLAMAGMVALLLGEKVSNLTKRLWRWVWS